MEEADLENRTSGQGGGLFHDGPCRDPRAKSVDLTGVLFQWLALCGAL